MRCMIDSRNFISFWATSVHLFYWPLFVCFFGGRGELKPGQGCLSTCILNWEVNQTIFCQEELSAGFNLVIYLCLYIHCASCEYTKPSIHHPTPLWEPCWSWQLNYQTISTWTSLELRKVYGCIFVGIDWLNYLRHCHCRVLGIHSEIALDGVCVCACVGEGGGGAALNWI
jgi:hypothetical protein